MAIAAIEDWPPLSTQPIGVQLDGTVVELHPPTLPDQLVTIEGGTGGETPTVSLGAAEAVEENAVLPEGQWLVIVDAEPQIITSDGAALAPATGDIWPISVA